MVLSNDTLLSNKSGSIKERIHMTLPPPDSGLVMPISFAGSGYALIRQLANSQTIATHQVSKYFRYFTPFSNKAGLKLRVVKKEAKFGTFCPLYNLGKGWARCLGKKSSSTNDQTSGIHLIGSISMATESCVPVKKRKKAQQ